MQQITIPKTFLEIAQTEGIGPDTAADLYQRKIRKKGIDDLVYKFAKEQCGGSDEPDAKQEREAKATLARVWKNFGRLHANRSIKHGDGVINEVDSDSSPETFSKIEYSTYIERAHFELEKLIGRLKCTPADDGRRKNERVAVGGDIHGVFADEKALSMFMKDPADTVVLMGDVVDMYASSKYRATMDHITVREELAHGRAMLEQFATRFKRVKIIKGNHDDRPLRRVQELYPQLLPLIVHPIDMLCRGLQNVEIISFDVPGTRPLTYVGEDVNLNFMGQVGDCIFGHFEGFYGQDAPLKLERWLGEWDHILNFERTPRAVFQAHTHRMSIEITPKGRMAVGTGCLCKPMAYQLEGHNKYKPPTLGYVTIYQDDTGFTKLHQTQMVPVG